MNRKPLGLYIHIPFCVRKCLYCDFVSGKGTPEEMSRYVRAVLTEIEGYAPLADRYQVDSVFFGGGTPSILRPVQLDMIMTQLRSLFSFAPDAEISLEANPGTLTDEKLKAYRRMGVNRLSLGLQSALDRELIMLGRIHYFRDFQESYRLAREAGFADINVDLMYALPRQTLADWAYSLEQTAALEPEHISAYSLIIEEGTPFYDTYGTRKGQLLLPGEETERQMAAYAREFLGEKGYEHYEISNYARKGYRCRHNMKYWTLQEYLGFGQNAASYLEEKRFENPREAEAYRELAAGAYTRFREMPPRSLREKKEEFMFLGLRTADGVSRETYRRTFGEDFPDSFETAIRRFTEQGFMRAEGDRLTLTEEGIPVSNVLLAEFLLEE